MPCSGRMTACRWGWGSYERDCRELPCWNTEECTEKAILCSTDESPPQDPDKLT